VLDARGRPRRWLDLGWEEAGVGPGYDGEEGHGGERNRRSDNRRRSLLQDDGWAMFYATDVDIYGDPGPLTSQVAVAIERRSRR
jgi:hypothetical protein